MTGDELRAYEEALDDVEGEPCSIPVGAPGSARRRAHDISVEMSALRMRASRLREALDVIDRDWHTSHYVHSDPEGWLACPACIADRMARNAIRAVLAADKETP